MVAGHPFITHSIYSSMSAINTTGGLLSSSDNIGGFGYGIGISVGILLLITTITLASYFCTRNITNNFVLPTTIYPPPPADQTEAEEGLDEATLTTYPKLLYSEAKADQKDDSTVACCSICLADYRNTDVLRRLPDCGHLFHLNCVDPWLRQHPTCPVCRTSPLPSPVSTPLAEVIPLATRPIGN